MTSWKDSLQRRDEVKAAFVEGYCAAFAEEAGMVSEGAIKSAHDAWARSDARKRLEKPLD